MINKNKIIVSKTVKQSSVSTAHLQGMTSVLTLECISTIASYVLFQPNFLLQQLFLDKRFREGHKIETR